MKFLHHTSLGEEISGIFPDFSDLECEALSRVSRSGIITDGERESHSRKGDRVMGKEIVFDYSKTAGFISEEEMKNMKSTVMGAKDVLTAKSGAGNDYLGWIDLPVDYDKDEFARIKKAAE